MKHVLFTIVTGIALIATPVQATENDAAFRDAKAIIVAANYEAAMDVMLTNLMPAVESGFIGELSSAASGRELLSKVDAKYPGGRNALAKRFAELFQSRFKAQYPRITDEAAKVYSSEFTAAELAEIRAFVESPIGRRMNAAAPKIQTLMSNAGRTLGESAGAGAAEQLLKEAEKYVGKIQ
jgi:hypothetical protein